MKSIKIILSVTIVIIFQIHVSSQSLNIEWQGCYGGTDTEYPEDIVSVSDGYLITGSTKSINGDVSFNHGLTDIWVFKISNNGGLIWEKSFGGSNGDNAIRIIPDGQNNLYIVGATDSDDGDVSNDPYPNSWDYWIIKIDISGNIIWEKVLGGNGDDVMWTATSTDDGGVVAIGWSSSNDGDVSINYGGYDMWMVKLNNEGEKEWDFSIGTDGFDYGQAIIQTSDGGFLVGGSSAIGNGGNLICTPNSWAAEAILVKLDPNLNIEWQHCYGGSDHDGIVSLIEIDTGYIFGAYTFSNDGDISGWHGGGDLWMVKVDLFGNIVWQNALGGSNDETTNCIFKDSSNHIISLGVTLSNDGDVLGNHSISEYDADIWIVKLNNAGELIFQQCIGGEGNEDLYFGIVNISDLNYVIAGQTDYGPSFDVNCTPHGGLYDKDFWVFEIKDTLTNIQTNASTERDIKVYPNPGETFITFTFQNTEHNNDMQLECFNIYGQKVHSEKIYKGQQQTRLDVSGWGKGLYFAVVKSNGKVAGTGRFVRK